MPIGISLGSMVSRLSLHRFGAFTPDRFLLVGLRFLAIATLARGLLLPATATITAAVAAVLDRFRLDAGIRLIAGQNFTIQFAIQHAFDIT